MTYELEPIKTWIGGNTRRLPFIVPDHDDPNNDWKDLTDATIRWVVMEWNSDTPVLSLDHPDVTAKITDPTMGKFQIDIGAGVGENLDGRYQEWVEVTTGGGERQTWIGTFRAIDNRMD